MSRISKLKPPEKKKPKESRARILRSQSTDKRTTRAIYGETEWRFPGGARTALTIGFSDSELAELNDVCEIYDCIRHAFMKDALMAAVRWARQQKRRRSTG